MLAACGGSEPASLASEAPTTAGPSDTCDRPGPSSLLAAVCQSQGLASLQPKLSRSFVAPKVDASGCTSSPSLVFYAADDWERLGQKLAADGYACAEYYVSIPPGQDDAGLYTMPRPGQVERLHSLGERFHAMAEIRVSAWQEWLEQHPGKTWRDVGIEARARMAAAGYDPAGGDLWAVNELPLAILTDEGVKQDMLELVAGLHDGNGTASQGLVFVVSPSQAEDDLEAYRGQVERLLEDSAFWAEMKRSVRFWGQEVYADSKTCCVAGADVEERAERLREYLLHPLSLARESGKAADARAFLEQAYTPVANAAWQWTESYGYTDLPEPDMARFVALQVLAMRGALPASGGSSSFGFAWAPVDASGMGEARFAEESGRLLESLARSIDDSLRAGSPDGACLGGPDGCLCAVAGAAFVDGWAAFGAR
jgi:hypothetical protein